MTQFIKVTRIVNFPPQETRYVALIINSHHIKVIVPPNDRSPNTTLYMQEHHSGYADGTEIRVKETPEEILAQLK